MIGIPQSGEPSRRASHTEVLTMTINSKPSHGEGDPEAAKRFNDAETRFVDSARGKEKVGEGARVRPDEEPELAEAERLGKARAKGADAAMPDERRPQR